MEHPSDTAGGAGPSPTILQKLFRDWASRQDAHQKRGYVKSWTGGSRTRPYAPHPPRFARHLPLKGKAFGRLIAVLSFRRGRTPAGPQMYAARPGGRALRLSTSCHLLGKARRGCGTAPTTILEQPGPSGPEGYANATQILRAGNLPPSLKYASPVMGSGADSPYQGEMARRARGGRDVVLWT